MEHNWLHTIALLEGNVSTALASTDTRVAMFNLAHS
jgi:hypothetical protein